ncbi:MAG: shikimate kinase [Lachnospiraceae bacterium]|jgi:shikimate kinase|nr:shikimate kinase [Lachnospiraceae bacterium]
MKRSIVLIGMMGSGKTTVGMILAKQRGWTFVDTDSLVEQDRGQSIAEIIAADGEQCFRDIESSCLEGLAEKQQGFTVVATGGGLPLKKTNRATLKLLGDVIYLAATPATIWQRLKQSVGDKTAVNESHPDSEAMSLAAIRLRPLLDVAQPYHQIERLITERDGIYRETADIVITTDDKTAEQVVAEIDLFGGAIYTRKEQVL